jgi:hypothetical protein
VFLSPVVNDEGAGRCVMSTTIATDRTCVNYWSNYAARIRMQDFTLLMPGKLMKGPVLKSRGKQKLSNKVKL